MKKTILAIMSILVLGWAAVWSEVQMKRVPGGAVIELPQGLPDGFKEVESTTPYRMVLTPYATYPVILEEYVPKVIIEGKWGTGSGEFGYIDMTRWNPNTEPEYPSSVAVDSKGNIYVLDQINNRIQKFNDEGKYLLSIPIDGYKGAKIIWKKIPMVEKAGDPIEKAKWIDDVSAEGNPTEAHGINIVINNQDNLYYYLVRSKENKGEVWQYRDDKLVRKLTNLPMSREGMEIELAGGDMVIKEIEWTDTMIDYNVSKGKKISRNQRYKEETERYLTSSEKGFWRVEDKNNKKGIRNTRWYEFKHPRKNVIKEIETPNVKMGVVYVKEEGSDRYSIGLLEMGRKLELVYDSNDNLKLIRLKRGTSTNIDKWRNSYWIKTTDNGIQIKGNVK